MLAHQGGGEGDRRHEEGTGGGTTGPRARGGRRGPTRRGGGTTQGRGEGREEEAKEGKTEEEAGPGGGEDLRRRGRDVARPAGGREEEGHTEHEESGAAGDPGGGLLGGGGAGAGRATAGRPDDGGEDHTRGGGGRGLPAGRRNVRLLERRHKFSVMAGRFPRMSTPDSDPMRSMKLATMLISGILHDESIAIATLVSLLEQSCLCVNHGHTDTSRCRAEDSTQKTCVICHL
mmetsp:Transcript_50188/g.106871  ORF Transcript_50188/g.106871 Transcript_50188/m.106871 type:complete len:232 (+) Transcript_50188:729-1424(+)